MITDEPLRREVKMLGNLLGEVIRSKDGEQLFTTEERVRALSKARRAGDDRAEGEICEILKGLDIDAAFGVCRAFTIFFDLANLAEDRHRVRVLRDRERERAPQPRSESIWQAVEQLHQAGLDHTQVQQVLDSLLIEPVFTAHPTEAKRRAVRTKLRRIRGLLAELDHPDLLEREIARRQEGLRAELTSLWETDLLRVHRPSVREEVARGLFFMQTLWDVVPVLYSDLRRALASVYPDHQFSLPTFLRFGSWIGGDRDGNPLVTTLVTAESLTMLRRAAIRLHLGSCRSLMSQLTQSSVRVDFHPGLKDALEQARHRFPGAVKRLDASPSEEVYKSWLALLEWRLERSLDDEPGAFERGSELIEALDLLKKSILAHRSDGALETTLTDWWLQAHVFGFHLARLDIRQESTVYQKVIHEITERLGLCSDYCALVEEEKVELLDRLLEGQVSVPVGGWSDATREVLELFYLLDRRVQRYGPEVVGAHVISMTHNMSDILGLLWLQEITCEALRQPLVPLFETIDDLERGPAILGGLLQNKHYSAYLKEHSKLQIVMIGYSDSTKDGGYLAANWWLYQAQEQLQRTADEHQVRMVLFHGRGGSLGRGGGPAARSILGLPQRVAVEGLRVTEQGEVLSERYDDPRVAYRHLEQLTWAMLTLHRQPARVPEKEWVAMMDRSAERALKAYRNLLEHPSFIPFFREATPVQGVEALLIGSRPSRRRQTNSLKDLRAIPWVFAWTQSRMILPGWFGLGAGLGPESTELLRQVYQEWPFFRAAINNAVLALAKSDLGIARAYSKRMADEKGREAIWGLLADEFEKSREVILRIKDYDEVLQDIPWLARSISIRNPYVDPLNLLQLEAFSRWDRGDEQAQTLLRMTIQGIASGLRTTG